MNKTKVSLIVVLAFILGVVSSNVPKAIAHGGDTNLIHSCVKSSNGSIRIVGANDICTPNETPLDWNAIGTSGTGGGGIFLTQISANSNIQCSDLTGASGLCASIYESPMPSDGRFVSMIIHILDNTRPVDATITLLVNGAPTAFDALIPAGSTTDVILTGNVTVHAGDLITLRSNGGGVPTTDGTVNTKIAIDYRTN